MKTHYAVHEFERFVNWPQDELMSMCFMVDIIASVSLRIFTQRVVDKISHETQMYKYFSSINCLIRFADFRLIR